MNEKEEFGRDLHPALGVSVQLRRGVQQAAAVVSACDQRRAQPDRSDPACDLYGGEET